MLLHFVVHVVKNSLFIKYSYARLSFEFKKSCRTLLKLGYNVRGGLF